MIKNKPHIKLVLSSKRRNGKPDIYICTSNKKDKFRYAGAGSTAEMAYYDFKEQSSQNTEHSLDAARWRVLLDSDYIEVISSLGFDFIEEEIVGNRKSLLVLLKNHRTLTDDKINTNTSKSKAKEMLTDFADFLIKRKYENEN